MKRISLKYFSLGLVLALSVVAVSHHSYGWSLFPADPIVEFEPGETVLVALKPLRMAVVEEFDPETFAVLLSDGNWYAQNFAAAHFRKEIDEYLPSDTRRPQRRYRVGDKVRYRKGLWPFQRVEKVEISRLFEYGRMYSTENKWYRLPYGNHN